MDITRLRTMRELMVRETMAEVAEVLCVTPSAISQHVTYLEEETGLPLVERNGRRIRLTHEGKRLAFYAEKVVAVLDEAAAEMAGLKGEVSGVLRVGAFSSIAAALLPHVIRAISQSYPKLRIVFEELESTAGMASLRAWKVDVAIVDDLTFLTQEKDDGIQMIPLSTDTLKVVVSREHRLAARRTVSMRELKDEMWAIDLANHAYSSVIIKACKEAGFDPQINAYSSNLGVILSLVKLGCSISVLPRLSLKEHQRDIRSLDIKPAIRRNILIACRQTSAKHPVIVALTSQLLASSLQLSLAVEAAQPPTT
ncbi:MULTISPECIES: LysR family transcriptional regulator [Variovorax]|uniref:LysR family transcriptional regulator n=1 Tax=Variovorax TaxID=34072 RepID=UPI0028586AFF|nr:LysR substrate-binding domain-containing protein [Variovorax sp. 3319]MDR6890994.1 DNA-binding transcriptional LysR family regulator [Variovorax sp. 3319]